MALASVKMIGGISFPLFLRNVRDVFRTGAESSLANAPRGGGWFRNRPLDGAGIASPSPSPSPFLDAPPRNFDWIGFVAFDQCEMSVAESAPDTGDPYRRRCEPELK